MNKTTRNLRKALTGEVSTCVRYIGYARKADEEGYPAAARLFRAAAMAEKTHALSHQDVLQADRQVIESLKSQESLASAIDGLRTKGTIRGTPENLRSAIEGETFAYKTMYPAMIRDAEAENRPNARISLEHAMSTDRVHAVLFKGVLETLEKDDVKAYFICPGCGYTVASRVPAECPYCGAGRTHFYVVQ